MDFKLELVTVPVSDVDRARAFYEGVGFRFDKEVPVSGDLRLVQLTPPGSGCSIAIGVGLTDAEPGSFGGVALTVADIHLARAELVSRKIDVSEIISHPFGLFVLFADPDGNRWEVQQLPGHDGGAPTVPPP